ncbi:putative AC transposase [Trichonephila clavipes]|nr:putative AC transposase [Trichonephila clavipes]
MTALDGFLFRVFCTSTELRRSLSARGFKTLPTSINTIRTVVNYSDSVRNSLKREPIQFKVNGKKFSLRFDEWTCVRNRRRLNTNVHLEKKFWNIGLTHTSENMPAKKCVEMLKSKLVKHGLSLKKDVVLITTDGAIVMKKVRKFIGAKKKKIYPERAFLTAGNFCTKIRSRLSDSTIDALCFF